MCLCTKKKWMLQAVYIGSNIYFCNCNLLTIALYHMNSNKTSAVSIVTDFQRYLYSPPLVDTTNKKNVVTTRHIRVIRWKRTPIRVQVIIVIPMMIPIDIFAFAIDQTYEKSKLDCHLFLTKTIETGSVKNWERFFESFRPIFRSRNKKR